MNLRSGVRLALIGLTAAGVVTAGVVIASGDRVWDEPPGPGHPAAPPSTAASPRTSAPDLHRDPADPTRPPLPDVSNSTVWASWAVLYLDTDHLLEGGERGTSTTASSIKVGIAADVLRSMERARPPRVPTPREHDQLSAMIRDSDDTAAEHFYRAGGGDRQLRRLIELCRLRHTTTRPGWWSQTRTTAGDLARLGACIARGEVASPAWVAWLLDEMRQVRGAGRFGFVETVPTNRGRPLAIKNGWVVRDGTWHVSCLAIADWWTMAALVRYPATLGLEYGARVCAQVSAALYPADDDDARTTASAVVRASSAAVYRDVWRARKSST